MITRPENNSNPQSCHDAQSLLAIEEDVRAKVRSHGATLMAARFGQIAESIKRQRLRHVHGCQKCLAAQREAEAQLANNLNTLSDCFPPSLKRGTESLVAE